MYKTTRLGIWKVATNTYQNYKYVFGITINNNLFCFLLEPNGVSYNIIWEKRAKSEIIWWGIN